MKLAIIGSGYVGLVAGTCFADSGNQVFCVDVDKNKIEQLSKGIPVIYEPGLEELLQRNLKEKRLNFTTNIEDAIRFAELIFIAVGTPEGEDGSADLKYVLGVAKQIGLYMDGYKTIVNKSTVPVGTADKVAKVIGEQLEKRKVDYVFDVVSNPEFLKEGTAIDDFTKPDRIIIGSKSKRALDIMNELYSPFLRTDNRIYFMDNKSAEVTKYAANSLLATKISFMNEIALLCEKVGANVDQVRIGIGSDSRIGQKFLFPGIGYGGSCFPKDVVALMKTGQENGIPMDILKSVEEVNERQKSYLFHKVYNYFNENLRNRTFAIWGLAFKPKTDDMREAPSIIVINMLLEAGAKIKAYDPVALENGQRIWGDKIEYCENMYTVLEKADALIIHTEWNEFRNPDFELIKKSLKNSIIFDGRNLYKQENIKSAGIEYYSIGR